MSPDTLQEVLDAWNRSDETRKNGLIRLFINNNGDFHAQLGWVSFLAEVFGIREELAPPATTHPFER